jgi:hypothetical protein
LVINVNVRHVPQESATAFLSGTTWTARSSPLPGRRRGALRPEELDVPNEEVPAYQAAVREGEGIETTSNSIGRAAIVLEPGGRGRRPLTH